MSRFSCCASTCTRDPLTLLFSLSVGSLLSLSKQLDVIEEVARYRASVDAAVSAAGTATAVVCHCAFGCSALAPLLAVGRPSAVLGWCLVPWPASGSVSRCTLALALLAALSSPCAAPLCVSQAKEVSKAAAAAT